jgi:hypothetical protein
MSYTIDYHNGKPAVRLGFAIVATCEDEKTASLIADALNGNEAVAELRKENRFLGVRLREAWAEIDALEKEIELNEREQEAA